MSFPTPSGDKKEFYMYNSAVMPDELANKFPNIKKLIFLVFAFFSF